MPEEDDSTVDPERAPSGAEDDLQAIEARRSRRLPIHGVLVAIDAPEIADQPWVVDAIDINANGMGMVMPPELPQGTRVLLTFKLADGIELARVPARVQHRGSTSGGVRFDAWPAEKRLHLLEFLVDAYEREPL